MLIQRVFSRVFAPVCGIPKKKLKFFQIYREFITAHFPVNMVQVIEKISGHSAYGRYVLVDGWPAHLCQAV